MIFIFHVWNTFINSKYNTKKEVNSSFHVVEACKFVKLFKIDWNSLGRTLRVELAAEVRTQQRVSISSHPGAYTEFKQGEAQRG